MAARVFRLVWLLRRVLRRAETLVKYGALPPAASPPESVFQKWADEMPESDSVTEPVLRNWDAVIEPINLQLRQKKCLVRPAEGGVSFIIYGPPGSGKTYLVKKLAQTLGWPLLVLNPGHFIKRGLELIEATASELFSDIAELDHTVVLFDECDELFRERAEQGVTKTEIFCRLRQPRCCPSSRTSTMRDV